MNWSLESAAKSVNSRSSSDARVLLITWWIFGSIQGLGYYWDNLHVWSYLENSPRIHSSRLMSHIAQSERGKLSIMRSSNR